MAKWPPKREKLPNNPFKEKKYPLQQANLFAQWYESTEGKKFIALYGKETAKKMGANIINNACEDE